MKLIRTVILIALALILGLWAFYGERHLDEQRRAGIPDPHLCRFEPSLIDSLVIITGADTTIAVVVSDTTWRIVKPVLWDAESSRFGAILRDLASSGRERMWRVPPDSMRYYSLEHPHAKVIYASRYGYVDSDTIFIGEGAANEKQGYVRFAGSDTVIMTNIAVHRSVLKSLYDFRKKQVFSSFVPAEIAEIKLRRGDERVEFVRRGERWRMIEPIDRWADADTINKLVKEFKDKRIASFADHPPQEELWRFGLGDRSRGEAEFIMVDDSTREIPDRHLRIGTLVPANDGRGYVGFWAMDQSRPNSIMRLPLDVLRQSDRSVENFWDRRIAIFERQDIDSVAVVRPNRTISVSRDTSATWRMSAPRSQHAYRPRVNYLVSDIHRARIGGYTGRHGEIANPTLRIGLFHGTELYGEIVFGQIRGNLVEVTGSDIDEICYTSKELFDKLNPEVDEFNPAVPGGAAR